MRAFGYFLVALGLAILIYQIISGEVCIGAGGKVCIRFATEPSRYLRWFFLYPAFACVLGAWMVRHQRKPNIAESIGLIVIVGLITMIGIIASAIYSQ